MQRVARPNISNEIVQTVRSLILDGALGAGERINEVHLAARLGSSRTPLREALSALVGEGAVTSVARIGFFVCPLTAEEVENLYPLRAIFDPTALDLAGLPPPGRIDRLKAINRLFAEASDPLEAVRIDDEWHFELIAGCGNPILLGFIEQMMWRTRRYELGLMRSRANVARATGDHDLIIARLEAGDLAGACAALRRNMESGKQPILDWLAEREALK